MDQHDNLQELLTRLNNIRDSMEEALGHVRGIEDDYRRELLEAHIQGRYTRDKRPNNRACVFTPLKDSGAGRSVMSDVRPSA
jgi:hypothetical protein